MHTFSAENGGEVVLAFKENAFEQEASHVLIICTYNGEWLLTDHKKRGLEFPGGKAEIGETLEQAARREVMEETGAVLKRIKSMGEYRVSSGEGIFVKRIFYGEAEKIIPQDHYFETKGPVFKKGDLLEDRRKAEYSFIMKDDVIRYSLEFLKQKILL